MSVSETLHEDILILEFSGRIDSNTTRDFEVILVDRAKRPSGRLLVDLQQVGYISSAGLRMFLICAKAVKGANGRLVLSSLNDNVFQIFEMSGFSKLFEFAHSRETGVILLT